MCVIFCLPANTKYWKAGVHGLSGLDLQACPGFLSLVPDLLLGRRWGSNLSRGAQWLGEL